MRAGDGGERRRPTLAFAYKPAYTQKVFAENQLARLDELCRVLDWAPLQDFSEPHARKILADAEILVTGWGCARIDRATLAAAPKLRLIAHAAGTVKNFVDPEVYEAGIVVTNAVAANAIPVAEYTLAAILFANKQVFAFRDIYRADRTDIRLHPLGDSDVGNWRKVVGIIGASRVGVRVMELLKPFDMTVLVHDPLLRRAEAEALGADLVALDELMIRSDVVSLHAPALDSTANMIDARRLALLRAGATFINTARGSLVEQSALEAELVSGRIQAVIDVTTPEVLPASSPLYDLPNVLLTPHIAGAVGTERERLGATAVAEVERYVAGRPLLHRVAPDALAHLA